ncbi:MAG: hypothetical protein CMP59_09755 [Flavobacteriales bacterium]|mgnify:CR=1 FL=1|nr:hypothetical protein [Flavobacteriales bacterium]|tara:strand:+ start:2380 stop:3942 length:1563 start_codon:yes stop_codon:yes gene_type:complete
MSNSKLAHDYPKLYYLVDVMSTAFLNKKALLFGLLVLLGFYSKSLKAQVFNLEFINPAKLFASLSIERINGDTIMILPLTRNVQYNRIGYSPTIIGSNGNMYSSKEIVDSTAASYTGWANSLNPIGQGNFVFAGNIYRDTSLIGTITTIDRKGDTIWSRYYGAPSISFNVFHQARETRNGDIIAVGAHAFRGQRNDGWLVRTDSSGNVLWDRKYSTSIGTQEFLYSVQETYDGGFILGGQEQEFPNNQNTRNYDPILIKVDSAGNQIWRYRYNTPYDDPTNYCIQTFDSNYVCAGSYSYKINGLPRSRAMLLKISRDGQFMWKKEYGPLKNFHSLYIVKQLPDSSLIAVGKRLETQDLVVGVMLRTKANGDSIFVRNYQYDSSQALNDNLLHDVIQMSDGGFMACGEVIHDQTFTDRQNPWLIRTDSNGCMLSSCLVGMDEFPFGEDELLIYPNPSNGQFQLSGLQYKPLQMLLYDLQGRELRNYNPQETIWQLPEEKGMYLLRIQTKEGEWVNRKVLRE